MVLVLTQLNSVLTPVIVRNMTHVNILFGRLMSLRLKRCMTKLLRLNLKKNTSGLTATRKLIKFMQNIFRNLDANAPSHMNAFDLSQRHIMSTKVGLKNVVCAIDTLPKDYFECDFLSLVRSMPINTAAFSRLKVTFDAVFVPYQQLWHGWNQFFLQTEERMSIGDSFDHTQLPRVPLNYLIYSLQDSVVCDAVRLWIDKYKTNSAYFELNSDFYFNFIIDYVLTQYGPTGTPAITCYDEFGYSRGYNVCRFLDQLGYGSFYKWYKFSVAEIFSSVENMLPVTYTPIGQDYDLIDFDATASNLYDAIDSADKVFFSLLAGCTGTGSVSFQQTLIDSFKYSWFDFFDTIGCLYNIEHVSATPESPYKFTPRQVDVNPFRALAYHKAWQDYTMNKRQQSYDPSYFNVDHLDSIIDTDTLLKIFSFRYDNWDYDLFTGVFNSPQTGDVSILNNQVSIFFKPSVGGTFPADASGATIQTPKSLTSGQEVQMRVSDAIGATNFGDTFTLKPAVSVYDIKRAEFLQRWKENHLRAGNKLRNQAIGQWNTSFKYMSDEYCDMITSWEMPVNIDEVINTADNQGDISGKGIGTCDGHFRYRCDDAGVILIMVSVKPRAEYDALMIDRQNTCLEIGDFPSPFFDNLGFESVPNYLLNFNKTLSDSNHTDIKNTPQTLGYTVRYASWKTAVDKVHGSLMSYGYNKSGAGDLAIWNTPRRDIEQLENYDDITNIFYVNPNIVDTIFGFAADGTLESDHFILNCNLVCKVIRNLSVSGQLMFGL